MLRKAPRSASYVIAVGLVLVSWSSLGSDVETAEPAETRVIQVLLLSTSVESVGTEREQRLVTELRLLLDADDVVVTPLLRPGFTSLSPAEQADVVAPLAEVVGAFATIWLQDAGDGEVRLHVLRSKAEQALTRSTTTETPNPEAELALAASELLRESAQTGLGPEPEQPDATSAVDAPVADENAEPSQPDPDTEPGGTWTVLTSFRASGAIGQHSPSMLAGGGLAVGYEAEFGWIARAGVSGSTALPIDEDDQVRVLARVDPGVMAGYGWRFNRARLAPLVGVSVPWSRFLLPLDTRDASYSRWNLRFDVGAEVTLEARDLVAFALGGSVGINTFRDRFQRVSDDTIETVALVEYAAWIGLLWSL
jgi:hypothetical protein